MTRQPASRKRRRREHEQQRRRRVLFIGVPVVVVGVVLAGLIFARNQRPDLEGLLDFGTQDRGHDEGVVFEQAGLPPVGGIHSPAWQNCGIYDQPIEDKNVVHSMEHGAIWLAYHPDLPAGDVGVLQELVRGRDYLLLAPYPGLEGSIVLTAWGIQLEVDSVEDERIGRFIDQYRLGPQTPEFGARCDGGVGNPLG